MVENAQIPKRVSKISKAIVRKYNVAQYETLEITVHHEDEIEWTTIEERQKKCVAAGKLLVDDFEKTRMAVFQELNESEKKAYFKNALDSMSGGE
jgi:hypothetical protein